MAGWQAARAMDWRTRAVVGAGLLAVALVLAVPVTFVVGLFLMLLGHVVAGLALFGASVFAAVGGVVLATMTGVRHVRSLIRRTGPRIVQLHPGEYRIR